LFVNEGYKPDGPEGGADRAEPADVHGVLVGGVQQLPGVIKEISA